MDPAANIVTGLARIGQVLRAQSWRQAEADGLSPTQIQILIHLIRRGPARVGALAAELAVTQPTVSDAAAALVRKGHAERRPDPGDGRATLLHPTASGQRLAAGWEVWPDALLAAVGELDRAERGVLLKALTRMIRSLQERGEIPVQRMCVTCRHFRPHRHPDAAAPHHCDLVDAAFGDAALRLDCGDHAEADPDTRADAWARFAGAA